ncbi:hypothetical protein [Agarilytica rhodophyticola]|uniref:hypothetical protein n=1 Tax=Agarilytica rhodophyticola TaxID=1737490 RepID=UPI000CD802D5|nr:hypothetical protein [Agarilytica rhodophyticola]
MKIPLQPATIQRTTAPAVKLTGGIMVKPNFTAQSRPPMLDPQMAKASKNDLEQAYNLDKLLNDPSLAMLRQAGKAAKKTVEKKLTKPGPHWTDIPAEIHKRTEKEINNKNRRQHNPHRTGTDNTGAKTYSYDNTKSSHRR